MTPKICLAKCIFFSVCTVNRIKAWAAHTLRHKHNLILSGFHEYRPNVHIVNFTSRTVCGHFKATYSGKSQKIKDQRKTSIPFIEHNGSFALTHSQLTVVLQNALKTLRIAYQKYNHDCRVDLLPSRMMIRVAKWWPLCEWSHAVQKSPKRVCQACRRPILMFCMRTPDDMHIQTCIRGLAR